MLKTVPELLADLGHAVRARRITQGLPQQAAASRSGVPERTLRRLEQRGEGSIQHLVQLALALRCEENLPLLFPAPAASSMDDLLARQALDAKPQAPQRVSRKRNRP